MRKAIVFALVALGTLGLLVSASGAVAADSTLTISLTEQNGSGENGTATITSIDANSVKVVLNLSNAPAGPQPAHIHTGTCSNLNPTPKYPLTSVANGKSETTVPVGLADLESGTFAINVHKSPTEASTYVSCGDIVAAQAGGGILPPTGGGDSSAIAWALSLLACLAVVAGARLKVAGNRRS